MKIHIETNVPEQLEALAPLLSIAQAHIEQPAASNSIGLLHHLLATSPAAERFTVTQAARHIAICLPGAGPSIRLILITDYQ